jgi:hypothetical protein
MNRRLVLPLAAVFVLLHPHATPAQTGGRTRNQRLGDPSTPGLPWTGLPHPRHSSAEGEVRAPLRPGTTSNCERSASWRVGRNKTALDEAGRDVRTGETQSTAIFP